MPPSPQYFVPDGLTGARSAVFQHLPTDACASGSPAGGSTFLTNAPSSARREAASGPGRFTVSNGIADP